MVRTTRVALVAAALAMTAMVGCAPPPGGGGGSGGSPNTGCWASLGPNHFQIYRSIIDGRYYWLGHYNSTCTDPFDVAPVRVRYNADHDAADQLCRDRVGPSSYAVFFGNILVPAQPNVYVCFGES